MADVALIGALYAPLVLPTFPLVAPAPPPLLTHPRFGFIKTPQWKASTLNVPANHSSQGVTGEVCKMGTLIFRRTLITQRL